MLIKIKTLLIHESYKMYRRKNVQSNYEINTMGRENKKNKKLKNWIKFKVVRAKIHQFFQHTK